MLEVDRCLLRTNSESKCKSLERKRRERKNPIQRLFAERVFRLVHNSTDNNWRTWLSLRY